MVQADHMIRPCDLSDLSLQQHHRKSPLRMARRPPTVPDRLTLIGSSTPRPSCPCVLRPRNLGSSACNSSHAATKSVRTHPSHRSHCHTCAFILIDASATRLLLQVCYSFPGRTTFDASKLSVSFLGLAEQGPSLPAPRRYTLTHSDFSGRLYLSIGQEFDEDRLSNWYLKIIRSVSAPPEAFCNLA